MIKLSYMLLQIGYQTAWFAKEKAHNELYGKAQHSYDQLRWYQQKLSETNPGSKLEIAQDSDGRFSKLFVCYNACYEGFFKGCRPLLFLDGTFLKNRYKGVLLAATAIDGNKSLFPLAYCICGAENADNWSWFLGHLRSTIYEGQLGPYKPADKIVIISDRDKGLMTACTEWFPDALHSPCVNHLARNLGDLLKGLGYDLHRRQTVEQMFKSSAYQFTLPEFNKRIRDIGDIAHDAMPFIAESQPITWANALFPGCRYGHVTSNCAESYNNWIKEIRNLPVIILVERIQLAIMQQFNNRREMAEAWQTLMCPDPEILLRKNFDKSRGMLVAASNREVFQVFDVRTVAVNVRARTCTCRAWDVLQIPCVHACAAIAYKQESVYNYIDSYMTVAKYKESYASCIFPVPSYDREEVAADAVVIRAPETRAPKGRPRTRRFQHPDESNKTATKCSRCHQYGHNRRTCTAPIKE